MTDTQTDRPVVVNSVSLGAGLAIAGAWIAGSAVTVFILLIMFVWAASPAKATTHLDPIGAGFVVLAIAAPMIASYNITKVILDKDD